MKKLKSMLNISLASGILLASCCGAFSCSCKSKIPEVDPKEDDPVLTQIAIDSEEKEFSVVEKTEYISKQLSVECFDQNGDHIDETTQWVLTTLDGDFCPDWININDDNSIVIDAPKIGASKHEFILRAESSNYGIFSNEIGITVNITPEATKAPDSIMIKCQSVDNEVFYTGSGDIQLGIDVFSAEYPTEMIDTSCDWFISKIVGNDPFDLGESPLFYLIKNSNDQAKLMVSKFVDSTYCGKVFKVTVQATSKLNKNAISSVDLSIKFIDGFNYKDSETYYLYQRQSLDEDWTLMTVPSNEISIQSIRTYIYDVPVGKISENFCEKSNISKLVSIILPNTVKEIGDNAFANQTYMYNIAGERLEKIGNNAFFGDLHLKFLSNYNQPLLTWVGEKAFYGCSELNLSKQKNITFIGNYAFYSSGLAEIDLGSKVTEIGNCCFGNCSSLKSIIITADIPPHLDGILYSGSTSLSSIKIKLESLEKYKNDTMWSNYSNLFLGI